MTDRIKVATHTGPIRIRVTSSEPVKAHALSAPIAIKFLGTPGPPGPQGTKGEQGLPGALDAGITIDGGNF